jgi:hypothetical protein
LRTMFGLVLARGWYRMESCMRNRLDVPCVIVHRNGKRRPPRTAECVVERAEFAHGIEMHFVCNDDVTVDVGKGVPATAREGPE